MAALQVRTAILRLLLQLNFFVEDRKDQLKKSRLGALALALPHPFGPLPTHPPASTLSSAVTVLETGCTL